MEIEDVDTVVYLLVGKYRGIILDHTACHLGWELRLGSKLLYLSRTGLVMDCSLFALPSPCSLSHFSARMLRTALPTYLPGTSGVTSSPCSDAQCPVFHS